MGAQHIRLFISCVTAEFGSYREALRKALKRQNVDVHVQEDFIAGGVPTLDKLNDYIMHCDAVIHLVGTRTGALVKPRSIEAIQRLCPGLAEKLPFLSDSMGAGDFSYTQWEAYLALYHGKKLLIAVPETAAAEHPDEAAAQAAHLARLRRVEGYPEIRFASEDKLANAVLNALVSLLAASEAGRRRNRILIAAVVAAVALGLGGLAWHSHDQGRREAALLEAQKKQADEQKARDDETAKKMAEMKALVEQVLANSKTTPAPGIREAVTEVVKAAEQGAEQGDKRLQQALDLLKANKIAEAETLFRAIADDKAAQIKKDSKDAAAAYRNLGAIAGLADPKRALDAYLKAIEFDRDDIDSLFWSGWLENERGDLNAAEQHLNRVLSLVTGADKAWHQYWARLTIGDIRLARGDLTAAMAEYRAASAIADRIVKANPDDTSWQRDLSAAYSDIGDVLVAQGNLLEALESYQAGLAITDRLAKANPADAGGQRDLAVSYVKVGDVQVAEGNLPEALASYQASLAIVDRLAKVDPSDATRQRDLSVSYNKVGDVQSALDSLSEALKSYQASLAIRDRLVKVDFGNAGWQRDLSVSYNKVGDIQVAQGNLPEAFTSYQASLAIRDRLAKANPGNAEWQRDLSVSYNRVGDVLREQGNLREALTSYQASLAIAERLAKTDPSNVQWQIDVLWVQWRLARYGDRARERWQLIVDTLRRLKAENKLTAEQGRWLPVAEQELARAKQQ